jgi:hypothetical protein
MVNMKRFILMFTAVMFLANTFAVSAWAKPCINMDMSSSTQETMAPGDMPCHESMKDGQNEKKPDTKHCDGVCLCFHVSINQTPILNDASKLDFPAMQSESVLSQNERVASMSTAPPRRPPKTNS